MVSLFFSLSNLIEIHVFKCHQHANELIYLQAHISKCQLAISPWIPLQLQVKLIIYASPPWNILLKNKTKLCFSMFSMLVGGTGTTTALSPTQLPKPESLGKIQLSYSGLSSNPVSNLLLQATNWSTRFDLFLEIKTILTTAYSST